MCAKQMTQGDTHYTKDGRWNDDEMPARDDTRPGRLLIPDFFRMLYPQAMKP